MHVLWSLSLAGARAPAAELASLDVHGNEPDAARTVPWVSEMPSLDAATDAARVTFLQHAPPSLEVDWASLPQPRLRHPAKVPADPVPWSSAELPSLDAAKPAPTESYLQLEDRPALPGRSAPKLPGPGLGATPEPRPAERAGTRRAPDASEPPGAPPDVLPSTGARGDGQVRAPVFLPPQPRDEERILALTRDLFVQAPLLFIVPGMAMAIIGAVLLILLRYLRSGLGAVNDWSAQLLSRTDWSALQDGAFVKVVGVAAAPDKHIRSPLGGRACAAYRISVAYDDGQAWVPLSTSEERTTFHVLDEGGKALLVAENDFHMYRCASQEWTFPAGGAPPEFLRLCSAAPLAGLRFREEVLALGTKVSCVGAVSRLKLEAKGLDSAGAIRPAYAVLMFRDDRIPWAKLTDLAAGDWKQLAARVLVCADR